MANESAVDLTIVSTKDYKKQVKKLGPKIKYVALEFGNLYVSAHCLRNKTGGEYAVIPASSAVRLIKDLSAQLSSIRSILKTKEQI